MAGQGQGVASEAPKCKCILELTFPKLAANRTEREHRGIDEFDPEPTPGARLAEKR